jgi:hypothetical protein
LPERRGDAFLLGGRERAVFDAGFGRDARNNRPEAGSTRSISKSFTSMIVTNSNTVATANDIRDIKPPVEIPNGWAWLWWLLAILAAIAVAFLVWRWWQKRKANVPIVPPIPAHVRAKQKLAGALALISQPKPFVIAVSDTARTYLEERFNFRAPERTTEEFLRELGGTDLLTGEQKDSLGGFLESCDLVKFAKYEPREPELRELHGSAVRLVEETEPKEEKAESGNRESGNEQQEQLVNRKS